MQFWLFGKLIFDNNCYSESMQLSVSKREERLVSLLPDDFITARNVSKYGVISGLYYPVFGLNTEIYIVNSVRIQENTDQKQIRIWTLFMQFVIHNHDKLWSSKKALQWWDEINAKNLNSHAWLKRKPFWHMIVLEYVINNKD